MRDAIWKAWSERSWNRHPKTKDTFDFNCTSVPQLQNGNNDRPCSSQRGWYKNTTMNAHEAFGLCCCEVCEENLVKKFYLLKKISEACDRQDLLAEQKRRNAVSRNSAQCTGVWQRIVCDITGDFILVLMQTEAELRLQRQLNSHIS